MNIRAPLLAVLVIGLALPIRAADNQTLSVDPHGKPKDFAGGKMTGYALWYRDGVWNLSATADSKLKVHFRGTVEVDKGKITEGSGDSLDKSRKSFRADFVTLHHDERGFDFSFSNNGGLDGVKFKVSDPQATLTFHLNYEGKTSTEYIFIGLAGEHPAVNPFSLPAEPPPAERAKKKQQT